MEQRGPIDFHCHLDDAVYDANRWVIIEQCLAAGFAALVTVADPDDERSPALTAEMLARCERIDSTIGAHPHQADRYSRKTEKRILDFIDRCRTLAVGEAGLDFHYDHSTRENQAAVFRRQIALARECALPLVVHSRRAEAEVLRLLDEEGFDQPVVFHCYTGDREAADEILARGYFLSFSGIITFKKAEELREVVERTPLERLFSETDSPYLAPEPERGRTNSPLAVTRIVEKIAAIKKVEVTLLLEQIEKNYRRLKR
ncbi:MAG: TatD family hydrolase [Candidatus Aminicenantes bacterium]|nr:TatD family hydrolase [Candidatus Aminicenantes bacterium]